MGYFKIMFLIFQKRISLALESYTQERRVHKNNLSYARSQKMSHSQIHSERIIREFTPRRGKQKEAKWGGVLNNKQRNKKHLLLKRKGYGFKCMVRKQIRLKIKKIMLSIKEAQKDANAKCN